MAPFAHLVTFITSILLVGTAHGQGPILTPKCSYTKDVTKLGQCLNTVIFAVSVASEASYDFKQACENLDVDTAQSKGLDVAFLQVLICGSFGGQGHFYGNTDDTIENLELAEVALDVSADDDTNLALRYICPALDLELYQRFQLPASEIDRAACSNLFIPEPTSSASSSSVSTTLSQSSSSSSIISASLTTPPIYPTSLISWPSGYSPTSCTTSSASVTISRRQVDDSDDVNYWIKVINSALFALGLIEADGDKCNVGDYWIDQWDSLGYLGDYVQALV